MLRIYKVYSFDYYPQKVLTIASSPGLLHSKDGARFPAVNK